MSMVRSVTASTGIGNWWEKLGVGQLVLTVYKSCSQQLATNNIITSAAGFRKDGHQLLKFLPVPLFLFFWCFLSVVTRKFPALFFPQH